MRCDRMLQIYFIVVFRVFEIFFCHRIVYRNVENYVKVILLS